ncbi:MAG: PEP-CTERM sorting domain-containing protein [Verrucomicrobiota bacterium]
MTDKTTLFDSRLKTVSIGATTLAVSATGLALTQKADAGGAMTASGFIINTDPATATYGNVINILAPLVEPNPIIIGVFSNTSYSGWNIGLAEAGLDLNGVGIMSEYLFWSQGFFTESQTFDLNSYDDSFFSTGGYFSLDGVTDVYIGLRKIGGVTPVNGWTYVTIASISHQQTVFNNSNPSNIAIGQIPEPHAALLLAAGATGLLAARRRRKKAA